MSSKLANWLVRPMFRWISATRICARFKKETKIFKLIKKIYWTTFVIFVFTDVLKTLEILDYQMKKFLSASITLFQTSVERAFEFLKEG